MPLLLLLLPAGAAAVEEEVVMARFTHCGMGDAWHSSCGGFGGGKGGG